MVRAVATTYPAVGIKVLGQLIERTRGLLAVNHSAAHGNRGTENALEQLRLPGMAHCVNPSLREGEVDGLCKVERDDARVSEVCEKKLEIYISEENELKREFMIDSRSGGYRGRTWTQLIHLNLVPSLSRI